MRSAVIVTIVLLASCTAPAPTPPDTQPAAGTVEAFEPASGDAQAMLIAARTAAPQRANDYRAITGEGLTCI